MRLGQPAFFGWWIRSATAFMDPRTLGRLNSFAVRTSLRSLMGRRPLAFPRSWSLFHVGIWGLLHIAKLIEAPLSSSIPQFLNRAAFVRSPPSAPIASVAPGWRFLLGDCPDCANAGTA